MKKILYISYFFPPINTIATYRAYYQVKYLALKGYKVDVICGIGDESLDEELIKELSGIENIKIIRIKNFDFIQKIMNLKKQNVLFKQNNNFLEKKVTIKKIIKKLYRFVLKNFLPSNYDILPDRHFIWLIKAYLIMKKKLKVNKYDLIYSSFGPPSVHILAFLLKDKKTPWVAEYRDLWSNNHLNDHIAIVKYFNKIIERKIIEKSNLLITVSNDLAKQLKNLHNKNVYVIYNGFEPYKITPKKNSKFTILYSGTIYEDKQDPTPLFKALEILKHENIINKNNFQIKYYGATPEKFLSPAQKFDILDLLNINGLVPHKEVLIEQVSADLLLLLEWNHPRAKGVLTGKFFEYLYAKKPILFIGYKYSEISEILKLTNSGVCLNKPVQIKKFLLLLMNNKIKFRFCNIEKFSREQQTCNLINLISKELNG